jgi:O-acetyl-ADP-ribose deacetylase (regulator of RNase III)
MIKYVQGDILRTKAQLIAHGVAPNDHFTNGLALSLRERWPAMVKDFRHYCRTEHPKPGAVWLWGGPGIMIANLMTQEPAPTEHANPGKASLQTVTETLKQLKELVRREHITSLALPRLATGVGGQHWAEVKPVIEHQLGDLNIPVYVYDVYRPGVEAE